MGLKTPTEILAGNPDIGWTAQQVGWLFRLGLVGGRRLTRRSCLVDEEDVREVYKKRKGG